MAELDIEGATALRAERWSDPGWESAWWWLLLPVLACALLSLTHVFAGAWYARWIGGEQGLLEGSHVVIPLISLALALRLLLYPRVRGNLWLSCWVGLAALGSFYIAGEEASWGQHYLGWTTSETWVQINDQGETNLHNTSSWLDQKPRTLLEIGVIVGGILLPLAALYRPQIRQVRWALIIPPLACLPVALLAEFTRLSEVFLSDGRLFQRTSEAQELFFFLFVLFYLVSLRRRLRAAADPAP